MDPATIAILVGLGSLCVERLFSLLNKMKRSSCCGNKVEFESPTETPLVNNPQK